MTHASLFSGIGGFDLAAQNVGFTNIFNCEIEPYAQAVLQKHFPNTKQYCDVKELNAKKYKGSIDVLTGGFPCQDISIANGKAKGITDPRSSLWSEFHRIIKEVAPKYVIIENSPQLLRMGFEKVLLDLSESGYNAEWECISATDFGFPDRRNRVYVIAYTSSIGRKQSIFKRRKIAPISECRASIEAVLPITTTSEDRLGNNTHIRRGARIPHQLHRIKGLGNAVKPKIIEYLFNCIKKHQQNENTYSRTKR